MNTKTKEWRPKRDKDGKLRLDSLDEASYQDIKDWMRRRLSGRDPFFPTPPDVLSSPQLLFVEIGSSADDRIRKIVERASVQLLKEFLSTSGNSAKGREEFLETLLRLLAGIRPLGAKHVLEAVIRGGDFKKKEFKDSGLDRFFVAAYAAMGGNADDKLLKRLLSQKAYAPDAFWGFALQGAESAAKHFVDLVAHFRDDPEAFALSALLFHLNDRFKDAKKPGMEVLLSRKGRLPAWAVETLAASLSTVGIPLPPALSATGIEIRHRKDEVPSENARQKSWENIMHAYNGDAGIVQEPPSFRAKPASSVWLARN